MPILAGLLTSLFSGLVGFFTRWLSKKVAIGASAVAVFAGLTVALYVGLAVLLRGLVAAVPANDYILMGLWVAFPDTAQTALSTCIAADTAIALYKWNKENLRLMAYIT